MKLDQNQLIDGFLAFIENFGKSVGMPVYLEYFPDSKNTAMCVKRNADTIVREAYIGGGYKADVTFSVLVQLSRRDKKNLLDVSRVLYALEAYMQTEEANGFPALKFDEKTKPIGLDMTSVPAEYEGDGVKLTTFMAGYTLSYEKKGRFE